MLEEQAHTHLTPRTHSLLVATHTHTSEPPLSCTAVEHVAARCLCSQQAGNCKDLALKLVPGEPFHPSMLVRGRAVPDAWPGGLPPALWRWDEDKISQEVFDGMRRDPVVKVGSTTRQGEMQGAPP